ncbi:MAG: Ig-like domain-containing protein [Proteobacteria bacterium]|nr:Ig-like domain-containing protein [Pseudomonadota bacterium]
MVVTAATGTNGTVTVAAGTVTYEPPKDFFGTMTITYTVSDGLATDTADVTVTVTPVDDPPVAVDDTATTAEDITLVIPFATLLANDTDVDGPTPTITATSTASHLTATVGATAITVVPDQDFFGTGGFDYTMTAGTLSTTAHVTVTITPVNDAPVAVDDARGVQIGTPSAIPTSALLANDSDVDGPAVSVVAVGNLVNCTATLAGATVTVTATAASASFDYTISDGLLTDVGTVTLTGTVAPVCGDGAKVAPEACDDGNGTAGDGCNAGCAIETGYACTGTSPSVCTPICGDNLRVGAEQCDNGGTDLDGCTSQCVLGRVCNAAQFPGGDHFAVDPATGHCYVGFDDDLTTWADAETACTTVGAHLATITSAGEDVAVHAAQNAAQNPWIGGLDDANDTDAVFAWVTGEAQSFTHYEPGQPDDDVNFGGNGECLHLVNAASEWNDTNCNITSFVVGRVCEAEVVSCGDAVREIGEACDDGNRTAGDGCSATCAIEPLTRFTFTGALGSEATVAADSSWGLAGMPVMSRGAGVASVAGADTFAGKGWSQLALLTTDYFAFTVTPALGRTLHLTRLELDERRSLSGPLGFAIRSSLDGFAADLVAVTIPDDDLTRTNEGVDLPAAFASVAGAVEFRIYGYGAELAAGTWRVDNVELTGTSTLP